MTGDESSSEIDFLPPPPPPRVNLPHQNCK